MAIYALTFSVFLAASSAPTPLYSVYQHAWGFSPTLLTIVFAAYAWSLLLTLLVAGRLPDYIGRRPVAALALSLEMLAMLLFWTASGPGWLIAARMIQGMATGLVTAAVSAALLDLHRERGSLINSIAPMLGMGSGALGSSALRVWLPDEVLWLIYAIFMTLFVCALLALWCVPETGPRQPGAWRSLRPRIAVPPQARAALLEVTPANIVVWMLGGFYLSLMPSLVMMTTHTSSPWLGGLLVAALTFSGGIAILCLFRASAWVTLISGEVMMTLGLVLILVAANAGIASLLLIGSLVAGAGFGMSFLGGLRTVMPLAEPHQRAGLMGAFFAECYLAHSMPTIGMGYLAQHTSILTATNVYGGVILVLMALAIGMAIHRRPGRAS